jgi:hypothetical protein
VRLGLSVGIAIALAGCARSERIGETVAEGTFSRIAKVCDQGRAVYVFKLGNVGGIAVVGDAPECRGARK